MSDMDSKGQVLLSQVIDAPVTEVWRALRDRERIEQWFGWNHSTLAAEIDYIFFDHAQVDDSARILRFEPWEGIGDSLELYERNGAAELRLIRTGAQDDSWRRSYDELYEGWTSFIQQLRLLVTQHTNDVRRTIRLSGTAQQGESAPTRSLGLSALRELPDGAGYSVILANGMNISGSIFHRTRFQLGLLVGEWNNGLLVVTDAPSDEARPYSGGSVSITTFGMDAKTFAAFEDQWRLWWSRSYRTHIA